MYRPPEPIIEFRLSRAFPAERLCQLARTSGLVERRRKLDAAALFWALTLGFAVDDRSIEALRQSYLRCVGGELTLTYASFHGWFVTRLKPNANPPRPRQETQALLYRFESNY